MTDVYAEEERLRRCLTAEEKAFYVAVEQEYYEDMINSMTPHERKHALKPSRMDLKGGHTHNHVKNAHKRMKHCAICDKPITKYEGFSSRFIGHICMECYIEECREHAVMAGIPTIGSLFDDLRNPYIRRK